MLLLLFSVIMLRAATIDKITQQTVSHIRQTLRQFNYISVSSANIAVMSHRDKSEHAHTHTHIRTHKE